MCNCSYKVVRYRADRGPKRTIETGLTEGQAQTRCKDPETSSRTATGAAARRTTRRLGTGWFYGYTVDRPCREHR